MEPEADQSASPFLMPGKDIKRELQPVTSEHMVRLKPSWNMSIQALIHRPHDLGVINETTYRSLFQLLSRAGYRKNEPLGIPQQMPALFSQTIEL